MIIGEVAINETSFDGGPSEEIIGLEFTEGLKAMFTRDRLLSVLNIDALFKPTNREVSCYDSILNRLNRDEKEQFLLMLNRCPSGWSSPENWPGKSDIEARIGGKSSSGAAMAIARKSGLAGLGATASLRSPVLTAEVSEIDLNTGEIREHCVALQHWYDTATALDFHDRRLVELQGLVENAEDIWQFRSIIYPRLRFLRGCRDQLYAVEPLALKQVADRLRELNESATGWEAGTPAPVWKSKVTPEYAGREKFCRFLDDSGNVNIYEMHARFTPGAGRIHFRLLYQEGMIEIAHIGKKLGE
ncbi:hypothetical protein ACXDF8_15545 [Mycolicibacterium sp. CBM1]